MLTSELLGDRCPGGARVEAARPKFPPRKTDGREITSSRGSSWGRSCNRSRNGRCTSRGSSKPRSHARDQTPVIKKEKQTLPTRWLSSSKTSGPKAVPPSPDVGRNCPDPVRQSAGQDLLSDRQEPRHSPSLQQECTIELQHCNESATLHT